MPHRCRVQRHDLRRLLCGGKLGAQPVALGLQRRQLALERILLDQSLHIGAIDALVLALGGCEPLLDLRPVRDCAGGEALPLLIVDPDIDRDGLAIRHALAQASHDGLLDLVEIVIAPVAAAARFRRGRAANPDPAMISILDGHSAAAAAAPKQAGQKMFRASPIARAVERSAVSARLDRVEHLRIDDREMRRVFLLVFSGIVDARDPPAGRRVFDHANPIPDHAAGIERIEQQAMAAGAVTIDRDSGPKAPARRRHGFVVEPAGDIARAAAGQIFGEDPADDDGLGLDDLQLARLPCDGAVAIGPPTSAAAIPDDAGEAAPHFLRQPLEEERGHRALEADMHHADLAIRHGDELHASELRGLIEPGDIGEVAREAIEILGQDRVELASEREADQALIVRPPMDRGA